MCNDRIRTEAKANGVKLWQVAERLGFPDFAFSKKLRRELPETEQEKIVEIIKQIAKEASHAENAREE